jgi:mannose-6-phosphate isomerase
MELASVLVVRKPWGSTDLRPWSGLGHDGSAIGELWFQRSTTGAPDPALLLKLLFTEEPLSIQVHPDDAFARSVGLANGKSEAWYVLSARKASQIALGLKQTLTAPHLRAAIEDGTIADLVTWLDVRADDAISVPAGTIHALGAGLVIAEVQQRSDATYRMFDYGRRRELHLDAAVGASTAGPAGIQAEPAALTPARTVLVANPYFILERVELAPGSRWEINAEHETWMLLLDGDAKFDLMPASRGEAVFLDARSAIVRAGDNGAKALLAYVGGSALPNLLQSLDGQGTSPRVSEPAPSTTEPMRSWGTSS